MTREAASLDRTVNEALAASGAGSTVVGLAARAWIETMRVSDRTRTAMQSYTARLRDTGFGFLLPGLTAAVARQTGEDWALAMAAEAAAAAGESEAARGLAAELHRKFPQSAETARARVRVFQAAGDAAALQAALADLPPDQAGEDWALLAEITAAETLGPPLRLLEAGQKLARLWPDRPEGYLAEAMGVFRLGRKDEADRGIQNVVNSFPHHAPTLQAAAEMAEGRGDFDAAQQRWADMRKRARHAPEGYTHALRSLERTQRMDLAPPILWEGLARFPDNIELLTMAARAAEGATQVQDADSFWRRAAALAPQDAALSLAAAQCLRCHAPSRAERMPEMLRRLQAHHARFPEDAAAFVVHLNALREMKRSAEAVEVSADWCARFPQNIPLALARAGALEDQGDRRGALEVVAGLRRHVTPAAEVEAAYVRALSCAGEYDAADAIGAESLRLFPEALRLLLEYARVATRRGDWDGAYERLLDARRKLPNDLGLAQELQNVRLQLAEALPATRSASAPDAITRFESLGGTGIGCEFGMVQRQLGYDSVGLLRWAQSEVSNLLDGLAASYEGVGEPERTVLKVVRHGVDDEEYVTEDTRFFMESHTFVRPSDAPEDSMFRQTCRRLRFLRGKLLEDLAGAEKIFVYKAHRAISDDEARALLGALQRHGDNAILVMMRADAANAAHSLRNPARGLYIGYVTHFMSDESGLPGVDITGWQTICAEVDAHWRTARHNAAAA